MKQLVCEMCGGTDLIKDGGVFVCQSCGCKYSVEEAKKMMIEGTVNVQGTVTVDNSANIEQYLQNARRAREKEDWEETEKYYNLVEQNDSRNIEAIFYSAFGKAKQSLVDADKYKREAVFNSFRKSISIIDDNFDLDWYEKNKNIFIKMTSDIISLFYSGFVFNQRKNGYGMVLSSDKGETYRMFYQVGLELEKSLINIVNKFSMVELYGILIKFENSLLAFCDYIVKNTALYSSEMRPIVEPLKNRNDTHLKKFTALFNNEYKHKLDQLNWMIENKKNELDKAIASEIESNSQFARFYRERIKYLENKEKLKIKETELAETTDKKVKKSIDKEIREINGQIHNFETFTMPDSKRLMPDNVSKLINQVEELKKKLTYPGCLDLMGE